MDTLNISLFSSSKPGQIGVGFHNIGRNGVLRASDITMINKIAAHYGERCGHFPLEAESVRLLISVHTTDIDTQVEYLSVLFGKQIKAATIEELSREQQMTGQAPFVVPYVNTPETKHIIHNEISGETWGLSAPMVHMLKNKADFYQLLDDYQLEGFQAPDYSIAHIAEIPHKAQELLQKIEQMITKAGIGNYPLGIMLRAAESDGNYGCALVYKKSSRIIIVPNGNASQTSHYATWSEALIAAQQILMSTMDTQKETRIVMSRLLDIAGSPGLSAVVMNGRVESLGWNSQLQKKGSKACIGTGTYQPEDQKVAVLRQKYEDQTVACLEELLRKTAQRSAIDFSSLHGVANIDIMLPGELEAQLQRKRGQKTTCYLAECNPRWTNYTDAIMTIIGANRQAPTINNIRNTIQAGLQAVDKYEMPPSINPREVRERIVQKDEILKREGTRLICRMAKNPLGVIFAGDLARAEQALLDIIQTMVR